jgi:chemotaxis protein methyltransferase CheR
VSPSLEALVLRLRDAITQHMGLAFDETKHGLLADVLTRRAAALRSAPELYLNKLEAVCSTEERRALSLELTVPETYFFRHSDQMRAFAEVALPTRVQAQSATRKLRLLSAGCASGEEPHSLAIMVRERALEPGWQTTLHAFDINPAVLEKARLGRYSSWALRETPKAMQERWFRREGREFVLDESIRAAVTFREVNLAQEPLEYATYDVIFCRNMMMYFAPEVAAALVAKLTRALAPGGYLFLGHAETLRGLSSDFHLCHTHGTFYYQRKDALARAADAVAYEPWTAATPDDAWPSRWIETVQESAARIEQLLARGPARLDTGSEPSVSVLARQGTRPDARAHDTRPAFDLSSALDLLKRERFDEALERVAELPSEASSDPDVLLLHAALLAHSGQLSAAEHACTQLLALDELNTGAHYLLALCRERTGDRPGALDHDQAAVYLDPTFAMPRLHLGLMARRAGERESARRELGQALALLRREDSARLLLFGGGFGRDALIALCQAELSLVGRS